MSLRRNRRALDRLTPEQRRARRVIVFRSSRTIIVLPKRRVREHVASVKNARTSRRRHAGPDSSVGRALGF